MGRKKKKPVKPWCWYCNREFDDEKILIQHQRAKHFKCPLCHKKLYSGPGLTVHCIQCHKEQLDKIPESLPNRNSTDIDIYGMQGIPHDDMIEHERSKRGDEGTSKSSQETTSSYSQQQSQAKAQAKQVPAHGSNMPNMQAAMFHHAMGMGAMPPGFPPFGMAPPPMNPNFMGQSAPHLGYPPMGPSGIPTPGSMSFPPPDLSGGGYQPHMHTGHPPPHFGYMASTSANIPPPPPPLSGVGPLMGIPPPPFKPNMAGSYSNSSASMPSPPPPPSPPPAPPSPPPPPSDHVDSSRGFRSPNQSRSSPSNSISRAATSSRHHSLDNVGSNIDNDDINKKLDYIEIPGSKSKIMHSDKNLSIEEIRMTWTRYRIHVS